MNAADFYQSKAVLSGHPLHPMFVVFPLGLFIAALIVDAYAFFKHSAAAYRTATVMIWFGFVGGLVAAVFGVVDYSGLPSQTDAHEHATLHLWLNLGVLLIFGINLLVRRGPELEEHRRNFLAPLLSALGVIIMLVSAWIGGELVYEHRVAVEPPEERASTEAMTSAERERWAAVESAGGSIYTGTKGERHGESH